MRKKYLKAVCFAVSFGGALPAVADPSFGFGVSFIFGGDVAVGARIFSTDEAESGALALGLDYKFKAQSFRPNVGIAYLDEDFYIDLSLGYDTNAAELDYGIGVGATFEVEKEKKAPSTTTTTTTTTTPTPPPTTPTTPDTDL